MKSLILLSVSALFVLSSCQSNEEPVNFIWLIAEDLSPDLGYCGNSSVSTPHLDTLASKGIVFSNAFASAPVCSASRSAFMTGVHQSALGAGNHRTSKANRLPLPGDVKLLADILMEKGYFVSYQGKQDLNFRYAGNALQNRKLLERKEDQPFFIVRQTYHTHRVFHPHNERPVDSDQCLIPSYYPEHPLVAEDWADYCEDIHHLDDWVGKQMDWLKEEGLLENSVVFFFGDHGRPMVRDKQFLYDGGLKVPLIVYAPGRFKAETREQLVSLIDLPATMLNLSGIDVPEWMHSRDMFGKARKYVYGARDRSGEAEDRIRSVRTKDYLLVSNETPEKEWMQMSSYKLTSYPVYTLMKVLHEEGEMNEVQDRFMQNTRPGIELYDVNRDPEQIQDIADENPEIVKKLSRILTDWQEEIGDTIPDPDISVMGEKIASKQNWISQWKKKSRLYPDAGNTEILNYWEQQLLCEYLPEGYLLEWWDEFSGNTLDTTKWAYRTDNKHRSIQKRENIELKDGNMVLNLKKLEKEEDGQTASGAGIVSRDRFHYGLYEVKARLGDGVDDDGDGKTDEGWHHSFWAMAADVSESGEVGTTYPDFRRTEVDCFENPGEHRWEPIYGGYENMSQHVIIWTEDGKEYGRRPHPPSDLYSGGDAFDPSAWHSYAFDWTADSIIFYIDGTVTNRAYYPASEFTHDQINVWLTAIATNWNKDDQENSKAEYDYFRYYKKRY